MTVDNGMMQRQYQWLQMLSGEFPGKVDLLSLNSSPKTARAWLAARNLKINVLDGPFAIAARLNALAWYAGGTLLCNKLRWLDSFQFLLHTPIPKHWVHRYNLIICYYAWNYHLLRLGRANRRVLIDLGDVMANRHERTGARRWISLSQDDEREIIEGAGRCLAISDGDVQEFERLYRVKLPIVPFVPANSDGLLALKPNQDKNVIGFIGAPSYLNEQILALLAEEQFLRKIGEAGLRLIVAGGICNTCDPELLLRLRAGGAEVIGPVSNILEFYDSVALVLNPVGPSTGVKIKSVEALMAGRLLITTRWGSDRTLEQQFPRQIFIINWPVTPVELASASIAFFRNTPQVNDMSRIAYQAHAEACMRWQIHG